MQSRSGHGIFHSRIVLIGFVLVLGAYLVMAVLAHQYPYFEWDVTLANCIQSIDLPGFENLMVWVSVVGTDWIPVMLVVLVGVGLWTRGWRTEAVVCGAGVGLGFLFNRVLKIVVARPRPVDSLVDLSVQHMSESYPSGHVVFFVTFFGFLGFLSFALLPQRAVRAILATALGSLILLVGCSRVYLGAHWPSDVFGAYLGGTVWLMAMIEVYRCWRAGKGLPGQLPRA